MISNNILARDLKFLYKGQRISVNGEFRNLLQWLDGRHVQLTAKADVTFNRLIPEVFLSASGYSATAGAKKSSFTLPDDLILDINFRIDSLTYKTFSSSAISGIAQLQTKASYFQVIQYESLKRLYLG